MDPEPWTCSELRSSFSWSHIGKAGAQALATSSVLGGAQATPLVLGAEFGTEPRTSLLSEHVFEKWEKMEFTYACFLEFESNTR